MLSDRSSQAGLYIPHQPCCLTGHSLALSRALAPPALRGSGPPCGHVFIFFFSSLKREEEEVPPTCEFCGSDLRTFLSNVDLSCDYNSSELVEHVSSKAGSRRK